MSYATDPEVRAEFIAGLRALADYLAAHQAVPVPAYGAVINVSAASTEDGGREEVNKVARFLRAVVSDDTAGGGHYRATRAFGAIGYCIVSIPEERIKRSAAEASYRGCVDPDPVRPKAS